MFFLPLSISYTKRFYCKKKHFGNKGTVAISRPWQSQLRQVTIKSSKFQLVYKLKFEVKEDNKRKYKK